MNRPLPVSVRLPRPQKVPDSLAMSAPFRAALDAATFYIDDLVRKVEEAFTQISDRVNHGTQGVGNDITAAQTISPSDPIHVIVGSAAIQTVVAPSGFSGPIFLIPDGTASWTTVTGGNIALASTAVPNKTLILVYNVRTKLWHPSY